MEETSGGDTEDARTDRHAIYAASTEQNNKITAYK